MRRDLVAEPVAYLAALAGTGAHHSRPLQPDLAACGMVMDEFLAADVVVIGVSFDNFSIASQLKAWIDRVMVAGKTRTRI